MNKSNPRTSEVEGKVQVLVHFFSKICLIIVSFLLIYFSYTALTSPITRGDSTGYHIPIAESILDGGFLHPQTYFTSRPTAFFPGSSEAILSLFLIGGIPLNLFNILGLSLLFVSLLYLGYNVGLNRDRSIIFATAILTLPVCLRWVITQFVDYWLALYFVLILALLCKPQNKVSFYVKLGILGGLLVGTKYSGPYLLLIFLLVFLPNFKRYLTVLRFVVFSLLVFLFGGFWYMRNMIITGNPFYPQNVFQVNEDILKFKVINAIIAHPYEMFSAFLSEYLAWAVAFFLLPAVVAYLYHKSKLPEKYPIVMQLFLVGLLNIGIFLVLPSEPGSYTHYISTQRYILPAFITFILMYFIIFRFWKKELFLSLFSFISMMSIPQLGHNPKLLIFLIPVTVLIAFPHILMRNLKKLR